jgi:agmatine deiminase
LYKKEVEPIWVKMASALTEGEKVHIVAYDQEEKEIFIAVINKNWSTVPCPYIISRRDKEINLLHI